MRGQAGRALNNNEIQWKEPGFGESAGVEQAEKLWMRNVSLWVKGSLVPSLDVVWTVIPQICEIWALFPPIAAPKQQALWVCSYSFPKILQTKQFGWQLDFHSLLYHEGRLRFDWVWNLRPRANRHKITAHQGDGAVIKKKKVEENLYWVSQGGISSQLAKASKYPFIPEGVKAAKMHQSHIYAES